MKIKCFTAKYNGKPIELLPRITFMPKTKCKSFIMDNKIIEPYQHNNELWIGWIIWYIYIEFNRRNK